MTEANTDWHVVLADEVRHGAQLLFRLAYDILKNAAAAEDVCQHAFMKAWESRGEIRERRAVRGWLARVVVNESLRLLRRQVTERRAAQCGTGFDGREATVGSPSDAIAARESVLLALAQLPERTRIVVTMRIIQGLPGTEVKELMGCSAAEVSRQLHAGMTQLQGLLADWQPRATR